MKSAEPIRYTLTAGSTGNVRYGVESPCGRSHFVYPATKASPKIYVVCCGRNVLYVGVTTQPVANRFYGAFTATGENGYYGYQWRDSDDQMHLDIWLLEFAPDANVKRELETIEAEVVYRVREYSGQWPLSQNEIHFHASNDDHRTLAARIYEFATNGNA